MPSPLKKLAIGSNVALTVVLALAATVAINVIAARHPRTWDWTGTGEFTLSEKTRNILKALPQDGDPVEIVLFLPEFDDLGRRLSNLLRRYETDSGGRVAVRRPASQKELEDLRARGFEIPRPGSDTAAIVRFGERFEEVNQSRLGQLSEEWGRGRRVHSFTGESAITFAVKAVTENLKKRVVFVVGHGELTSRAPEIAGIRKALAEERIDATEVNLMESDLAGADLAVVWAPSAPWSPQEVAKLDTYLRGGGRGLFLMEPHLTPERKGLVEVNLETELAELGIRLGSAMVLDLASPPGGDPRAHIYRGGVLPMPTGNDSPDIFPSGVNPAHAITKSLHQMTPIGPALTNNLVLYTARAVEPANPQGHEVTRLLQSSEGGYAMYDLSAQPSEEEVRAGAKVHTLAVVLEKTEKKEGEEATRKTRIAVFGDADFPKDEFANQLPLHKDLFMNVVNWLLEKEDSLGIGPKSGSEMLNMSLANEEARSWVFRTCFLFLPGGALILGLFVWMARKE